MDLYLFIDLPLVPFQIEISLPSIKVLETTQELPAHHYKICLCVHMVRTALLHGKYRTCAACCYGRLWWQIWLPSVRHCIPIFGSSCCTHTTTLDHKANVNQSMRGKASCVWRWCSLWLNLRTGTSCWMTVERVLRNQSWQGGSTPEATTRDPQWRYWACPHHGVVGVVKQNHSWHMLSGSQKSYDSTTGQPSKRRETSD